MGGMAAQIPIKNDVQANEQAMEKVRADKLREVQDGHDGTWVAHPGLVATAFAVFNEHMPQPNQINRQREDVHPTAAELLRPSEGIITERGLKWNLRVGIQYLEAWLGGNGCVPLYNLMEDAATAEISRSQVWQWLHHGVTLEDGRQVTPALFDRLFEEEMESIRAEVGSKRFDGGHFRTAGMLFSEMIRKPTFTEFLTLPAYENLE